MITIENYINGKLQAPLSNEYLKVYQPATGNIYASVPDSHLSDIEAAVDGAKSAFSSWSNSSAQTRSEILLKQKV